jgi:hypothetical protein
MYIVIIIIYYILNDVSLIYCCTIRPNKFKFFLWNYGSNFAHVNKKYNYSYILVLGNFGKTWQNKSIYTLSKFIT